MNGGQDEDEGMPLTPWLAAAQRGTETPQEISADKLKSVRLLYGQSLNDADIAGVAELETEYPRWHIWPHINFSYPDYQVYYARRLSTSMEALQATGLPAIRAAMDGWISGNTPSWDQS